MNAEADMDAGAGPMAAADAADVIHQDRVDALKEAAELESASRRKLVGLTRFLAETIGTGDDAGEAWRRGGLSDAVIEARDAAWIAAFEEVERIARAGRRG